MEKLVWKLRIVVLWIYLAVGMSAAMILFLLQEGVIEDIIEGEMEGMEITTGVMVMFAVFWLIPLTMAFLTLVLKDLHNRWASIILGLFFGIFYIADISGHLSGGESFSGHILMGIAGIVVAFLIFYHGWKWPKEEAPATEEAEPEEAPVTAGEGPTED